MFQEFTIQLVVLRLNNNRHFTMKKQLTHPYNAQLIMMK